MTDSYRIRSPETWAAARDDYLAGMEAEAVCSRHDLGLSAFRRRARRGGWRRLDQDDPAPVAVDLAIYDDFDCDEQVELARLRFIRALHHGRAAEAARWRWLWRDLQAEVRAFDEDLLAGATPEEIAALLAADADEDEDEVEVGAEAPVPSPDPAPSPGPPEKVHAARPKRPRARSETGLKPLPGLPRPGKVHDVHSGVSSAQLGRPPPAGLEKPAAPG